MKHPKQSKFTADEFIAWAMKQSEGYFELDHGVVPRHVAGMRE